MEHTATFFGRLVANIVLVGRMIGCRIVVQKDCFGWVQTHTVVGIVATKVVVDMMVPCFGMVDSSLCRWVALLLEKLTAWR